MQWLETANSVEKEEIDSMKKDLESVANQLWKNYILKQVLAEQVYEGGMSPGGMPILQQKVWMVPIWIQAICILMRVVIIQL